MKHSWQTLLWELWAALCLCTVLSFGPLAGSLALVWPGLALAAAVPLGWGAFCVWAQLPAPLPPEQPLEPARPFDFATLCDLEQSAAVS